MTKRIECNTMTLRGDANLLLTTRLLFSLQILRLLREPALSPSVIDSLEEDGIGWQEWDEPAQWEIMLSNMNR